MLRDRSTSSFSAVLLPVAACLCIAGCGTVQTCVPGRPLPAGDTEGRIGASFSTSRFSRVAVQGGVYRGLSDQDVLGLSFNSSLAPSRLTYARYFRSRDDGHWNGNLQAHLGSLLGRELNPVYEIDVAVSHLQSGTDQSLKAGLGFYAPSLPGLLAGRHSRERHVAPVLGYQVRARSIVAEAELTYDMSAHQVGVVLEDEAAATAAADRGLTIPRDEVVAIDQLGEEYGSAAWIVRLANGETLTVAGRDPYADCLACAFRARQRRAYLPSADYRALWVYGSERTGAELLTLNMRGILAEFALAGDLRLVEDSDLIARTRERVRSGVDDLGLFIGYRQRDSD